MGSSANPYVFVAGVARSGTTLLQRMLDAHPLLAVVNEAAWVPRKFSKRHGVRADGRITPALIPQLVASTNFANMGLTEEDLRRLVPDDEPLPYRAFVSRVFDLYAARRHKRFAGDKSPGYIRRLPRLHQLWPRARYLHIIRDPRDVCLSMLDWPDAAVTAASQYGTWDQDPVVSIGLYWKLSVGLGREASHQLAPGRYCEVRYEELVATPEAQLRRISEFLQIPYDNAMVRYHEGRMRVDAGLSSKDQWLPPTVGLRNWRTQMDSRHVQLVEVAAGTLLDESGYTPGATATSRSIREHVEQLKQTFGERVIAKEHRLPRNW